VPDVMVSYRSADARFGAAATFELLSAHIGRDRLFLDNQSIPPGASYVSELTRALESISVLLVLIGPAWLADDPRTPGRLLVSREDDWVRGEVRRALEREVHVIPVLLDGTSLPDVARLPHDIRGLVQRQAVEVRHHRLGDDVRSLSTYLEALLPSRPSVPAGSGDGPPHQLPARLSGFVGRGQELDRLDQRLWEMSEDSPTIVVLCGTAGVGKTTLSTHWAHRAKHLFPNGQLYANLRGFDSRTPAEAGEILHGFLTAFGVPPAAIPDAVDSRAALFRSQVADRRVLVVLDNAYSAEQVRPLLPGSQTSFVLVTSRARCHGLAVREGAEHLPLTVLAEPEARDLLAGRLGRERAAAESDAIAVLLRWCAGLPLALSMIGTLADERPTTLSETVRELDDERDRLGALELGDDDLDLRSVFSWSYNKLSGEGAHLFRLLGLHPGPDISRESVLAMGDPHVTRQALTELTRSHLLDERVPGRFSLHDLLRLYAVDRARHCASESERRQLAQQMVDHYLTQVSAAARWLEPNAPEVAQQALGQHEFADYQEALNWCEQESAVIFAITTLAAEHGFDSHVWRIATMCNAFLRRTGRRQERVDMHRAAVAAATRAGDELAQATAVRALASALARQGNHEEAQTHLMSALSVFERAGDRIGQLQVHLSASRVLEAQQRHDEALVHGRAALELARADDGTMSYADAQIDVGHQLVMLGVHDEALHQCTEALLRYEAAEHVEGQANCLLTIGILHERSQEYAMALTCYDRSSALDRQLGDRYWEAVCAIRKGEVYAATARLELTIHCWRYGWTILSYLHHPDASDLRAKLAACEQAVREKRGSPG
jgi:tetratricopeptide (TPR) repeat protein